MGIIISNGDFKSTSLHDDNLFNMKRKTTLNEQIIMDIFDISLSQKCLPSERIKHHDGDNSFYFINVNNKGCYTLLQMYDNKYIILQLQSKYGSFCAALQYPTIKTIKITRHDLYDKIILCILCLRNVLCYDMVKIITKTLIVTELQEHCVTCDATFSRYYNGLLLRSNYEDFILFI